MSRPLTFPKVLHNIIWALADALEAEVGRRDAIIALQAATDHLLEQHALDSDDPETIRILDLAARMAPELGIKRAIFHNLSNAHCPPPQGEQK